MVRAEGEQTASFRRLPPVTFLAATAPAGVLPAESIAGLLRERGSGRSVLALSR